MKLTSTEIRLLRQSRGMMQKQVAAKMDNISKQRYCQLENQGELQSETQERLLKALNYTLESAKKFLASIPPPANVVLSSKK